VSQITRLKDRQTDRQTGRQTDSFLVDRRRKNSVFVCKFVVYDTHQVVGGRRFQLSPEEYITGALELYIDIVYIFLMFLDACRK